MLKPNWTLINKCGIWRVLGVTECNGCPNEKKCWGEDVELPEPQNTRNGENILGGITNDKETRYIE